MSNPVEPRVFECRFNQTHPKSTEPDSWYYHWRCQNPECDSPMCSDIQKQGYSTMLAYRQVQLAEKYRATRAEAERLLHELKYGSLSAHALLGLDSPMDQISDLALADNRAISLTPSVWSKDHEIAFSEGQCLAFAVALATLDPELRVRIIWREDNEVSHAVAYDVNTRRVFDVHDNLSDDQWQANARHYYGSDFDFSDHSIADAQEIANEMKLLPKQNYTFARLCLQAKGLPAHLPQSTY